MRPEPIDPKLYYRVFQNNSEGNAIFEELCRVFYDSQSYSRGDAHETSFNEGKRAVLAFIINKIAKSGQEEQLQQQEEEGN